MAFPALSELGCCEYFWRWLPEDFAEAWATWDRADQMALLLVRIGFPFDEVVEPALPVFDLPSDSTPVPLMYRNTKAELKYRTPEVAAAAVAVLCYCVPEAEGCVCDLYRGRYPLADVAERFFEFLGRGPTEPAARVEPILLGRPA